MVAAKKHKIVVVEDEGLIAADLESRLKDAGYSVSGTADSAPQALRLIRSTAPDLVLMDIRLKGEVDGIQVAEQVSRDYDVPVVFLTAYDDRGTLARASHSRAFGYIKKPIASSSLRGSIELALAKHHYERELRAERDWLASSFSAVPYAVLVTNGSGRIAYLNEYAEELTGWSADQAMDRPSGELLRLLYGETGNPVEDFVPLAMLQGDTIPLPADVWLKNAAGRNYNVEGNVTPRWEEGRVEGAVITLADTTLRKFAEEQSRQENKQEALVRLADGFRSELPQWNTMAEDCARLLEALPRDSDLRQDAETIQRAAVDAFAVTHRLRRFLEPPEVQPGRVLLNEVLSRLEEAWRKIQPSLTMNLDPAPVQVLADEWELTRSLASILLHARRRMSARSELILDASDAVVAPISYSARIRIVYTTRDEDATSLERVFEPSWLGESNELPVAYRIIKKMGGLMTAHLRKGNSVAFDIYLARVDAAEAGSLVPKAEEPAVLLIEPNPEVRRVLHLHFQRHGYRLLEAEDCEEGLLLAGLYPAQIPLVIANPENDDGARGDFARKMTVLRPRTQVRVLAGYYESCRAAGAGMASIGTRHLTKWNLLTWAQDAFAGANSEGTAG